MSTNKTENYQLHSWVPQDEFHLTEINENFTLLDSALKAEAGSREALAKLLSGYPRMVTGSYTGKAPNNQADQTPAQVTLGFKPKAVVIMATALLTGGPLLYYLAIEGGTSTPSVTLEAKGFTARNDKVYVNYSGTVYHYAAFY